MTPGASRAAAAWGRGRGACAPDAVPGRATLSGVTSSTTPAPPAGPRVVAVARRDGHGVGKDVVPRVLLLAGEGVFGDAHAGAAMRHRSRDKTLPNVRQVHMIQSELFDELAARGFDLSPGVMGENVTTRGVDLLALPIGARLHLGAAAVVELTGLRNPCVQLQRLQPGLMDAVLDRAADGSLIRRAGVMGVVLHGGEVQAGDAVVVQLPPGPRRPLIPV